MPRCELCGHVKFAHGYHKHGLLPCCPNAHPFVPKTKTNKSLFHKFFRRKRVQKL